MDALAILAFVIYIVIRSLGDRNRQQRQRQEHQERSHPLDQRRIEPQPWDTVFETFEPPVVGPESAPEAQIGAEGAESNENEEKAPYWMWEQPQAVPEPQRQSQLSTRQSPEPEPQVAYKRLTGTTRKAAVVDNTDDIKEGRVMSNPIEELLSGEKIAAAFILSEVLRPPKALRK